jgi:hypothetical protein
MIKLKEGGRIKMGRKPKATIDTTEEIKSEIIPDEIIEDSVAKTEIAEPEEVLMFSERINISKKCERKVNLSGISNQYDNITVCTFVSKSIEGCSEEKLRDELRKLHWICFEENERDIKAQLLELKGMSEDKNNLVLMGTGRTLNGVTEAKIAPVVQAKIENIKTAPVQEKKSEENAIELTNLVANKVEESEDDLDDFFSSGSSKQTMPTLSNDLKKPSAIPEELKEVDLSTFDIDSYQGEGLF